jgi:transposase InsO family protein
MLCPLKTQLSEFFAGPVHKEVFFTDSSARGQIHGLGSHELVAHGCAGAGALGNRACFVIDTTADDRQIKCLTVVDEYTRGCLAIDVARAIRSKRVIDVLARLVSLHGAPLFMRSDNGPEFVSHASWSGSQRAASAPH